MRKIVSLVCSLLICAINYAQNNPLTFRTDGTFKIVQFTDVHYIHNDPRSDVALEVIKEVLDAEKPDLVMLTGDIVFAEPAKEGMKAVLDLVSQRKIPFGVMFGNHDDEHNVSREELYDLIRTIPYNVTGTAEGLSGVTNYILPVNSRDGKKEAAVIYCMDSHAYSQIEGIKGYDYIKSDQIEWYKKNSREFTRKNNGSPLPSLAFFHIPIPEYNYAAADEKAKLIGTRMEKACAPELNSGLFTAMKEMNDVMGTFVGHDHDCDYVVYWKGILLGYGRYTGGNTVYNNLPGNGARIIELKEGKKEFKTWIRLKGNKIINEVEFPGHFEKK